MTTQRNRVIAVMCNSVDRAHHFMRTKYKEMYACSIPATLSYAKNEIVVHYKDCDIIYKCFFDAGERIKGHVFEHVIFEDYFSEEDRAEVLSRTYGGGR